MTNVKNADGTVSVIQTTDVEKERYTLEEVDRLIANYTWEVTEFDALKAARLTFLNSEITRLQDIKTLLES